MTIKRVLTAIALAALMGIVLPVAIAQAPPCFTFDGQIKTIQCPVSFRPAPVQYYSDSNAQNLYQQTTDDNDLPSGFFDQRTVDTLRQNAAQNQTAQSQPSTNATQTPPATNLTISDIAPVRFSLNTARQSLEHNDTQAAIESINRADGTLFAIMLNESKGPFRNQLIKLSDNIDTTRESLRNLDNEKAVVDLNATDSQLLVITEALPTTTPTGTEEEESEPQTFPFGYPEEEQEMIREDNQNQTIPSIFPSDENLTQEQQQADAKMQEQEREARIEEDKRQFAEQLQQIREGEREQENQTADVPFVKEVPANETEIIPPTPTPEPIQIEPPTPAPEIEIQPVAPAPEEPIIKIPLNKTQQELVTIEEVAGLNKTTHEKTTISIIEGNKTTHREITTTELPLSNK